jgi:Mrp family chromosome partitioning ATPase
MVGKRASAVIVTTPQRVSVDDVRKSIDFCRKLEMPVARIVENMSGFVCPHCGKTVDIFETGGGVQLAKETGVPFLGSVPLEPLVVRASDAGKPFVTGYPDSPAACVFHQIVESILALTETKEK